VVAVYRVGVTAVDWLGLFRLVVAAGPCSARGLPRAGYGRSPRAGSRGVGASGGDGDAVAAERLRLVDRSVRGLDDVAEVHAGPVLRDADAHADA
jgi:hypothetical protein